MRFRGINHIAFATGDMDETIRFWRDLLELRLVGGVGEKGARQYFFEVGGGSMVSFFEWPGVEPVPDKDPGRPVEGPFVFDHLCLEVEDEERLWSLKDRLDAAGVWVTEVLDNGFIHSFFSTDPNNIQVEFCYRIEEIDLGRAPRMTDPHPTALAREGAEPREERWSLKITKTPVEERRLYRGPLQKMIRLKNRWEE